MSLLKKAPIGVIAVVLLSGCASIVEGRSQQMTVNTNPNGASCVFMRQGLPVATVEPTPNSVYIEKNKYDITVECSKDGYQKATYFNHSGTAGATWGNIVLGGLIGWGIDSASGSDNKYESPMNISLVPNEVEPTKKKPTS